MAKQPRLPKSAVLALACALDPLCERVCDRVVEQRLATRARCQLSDSSAHRARAKHPDHSSCAGTLAGFAGPLLLSRAPVRVHRGLGAAGR